MTRMIPIKEAINIFEKHKIEKIKNDNPLLYRSEWEMSGFSTINYIIQKITEIPFENRYPNDSINIAAKSLLKLVSKRYNRPDRDPHIQEGLQLYGKAHTEISETPYGNSEIEFEKIYKEYYPLTSEEIEIALKSDKISLDDIKKEDKIPCELFENYDYDSFYNSSINYTVMGSKHENKIRYTDISVKFGELMELIDREFKIMPAEYNLILDDMISKYGDTITNVWKQTRELYEQIHILKVKQDEALGLYKEHDLPSEVWQSDVVCDQILEIQRERAKLESFNRWHRESKSYEKDLDAFFKEDIKLQKEYNNEIDAFLCKLNSSKFIDNLIKDLKASLPEREEDE